jgi:hypothetical protein
MDFVVDWAVWLSLACPFIALGLLAPAISFVCMLDFECASGLFWKAKLDFGLHRFFYFCYGFVQVEKYETPLYA